MSDAADRPSGAPVRRPWLPRPRRRLAVVVVTALLGAAVLLWGADRLARGTAEALVAGELQRLTGTPVPPEVELRGPAFLLQSLSGRYDRIDVTLRALSNGPLRIDRLDAELTGVRISVGDLVRRNPEVIGVESATGRALLTYEDLDRYLEFTGRPYDVRPGAEADTVRLAGQVRVLGEEYDVTVDAALGAEAGALTVTPDRIDTGSDLDPAVELLLGRRFTFVIPLDPLPFGQQVTDVAAQPDGIVVRTAADGLLLRPR